jgi:two-component system CheB/CheR fusion protein
MSASPSSLQRALARPLAAWAFAVGLAAAVTLLNFWVQDATDGRVPFLPYFATIIVLAYYAGLGPALLFLVLAVVAVHAFWMAPPGLFEANAAGDVLALVLFAIAAGVMIRVAVHARVLSAENVAARQRLDDAHAAIGIVEWQWHLASGRIELSASADKVFGRRWPDIDSMLAQVHPDDVDRVRAVVERGLAGDGYSVSNRIVHSDGEERWLDTHAVVHRAADGRATHVTGVAMDVTEKRRVLDASAAANAEAQRRAAEVEALLDSVPAIIWIARGRDCREITGSAAAYEALRMTAGSNLSKTPGAQTAPPTHFRVLDENGRELAPDELPLQRVAATGERLRDYREQIVFDDGSRRVLFGNAHPLRDAAGDIVGAVAGFSDVTALVDAEAALRRASDEFLNVVRMAPIGIVVARDPECRVIISNRYVESLLGAPSGGNVSASAPAGERPPFTMRRNGRVVAAADMPMHKAAARGKPVLNDVLELERADGSVRELIVSAVPLLDDDGRPRGAIGTLQDVTELRAMRSRLAESEERLRLAVEGADLGLWDTDLATATTECSERNLRLFGLPPEPRAVPSAVFDALIHADDRARVYDAWERAVRQREPYHVEYRIRRADGSERWVESRARVRFDDAGRPVKVLGVTLDVTERKQAEEAVRDASLRKDEFIATLAHELRNPLAPIRFASRLFRAGTPPDMIEDAGRMIERQLSHMARLLDDLLDVSRVTRGALELRVEPLDLRAIVRAAVDDARPLADKADHRIELRLPDGPLRVDGDVTRLTQILGNLLNNATKFTEPGGRIVVEVAARDGTAAVEVVDNGRGIQPDLLPHIFDLFAQGERGTRTSGLGIGLALAQRLAVLHGGRLSAASDGPGKGSRFVLELPLAGERPAVSHTVAAAEKVQALGAQGTRVLIVDDNVDAANSLEQLLTLAGYTTKSVHDGVSALEVAEVLRPNVVLLDLGLPNISGFEVARRLRASAWGTGVRLIAITGWGQERDRLRTQEAGFDDHLTKPVDPETLLSLLAGVRRAAA